MSQTYGMFAIVLGALGWIFLQARVVVYAAEVNVVRRDRLWPRSLVADRRRRDGRRRDVDDATDAQEGPTDRSGPSASVGASDALSSRRPP